MAKVKID